ncbi:hypothetical protein [Chryseobacterium sp. FH1]|uniref:hypothetical protein n=1 Tax=Chryseobacterium sp. FH1 TaxID=1233951 RepID=UPI0004E3DE35|nr:hypothetical protein [Chryseobacterium sp. FH1]KFC24289.1 hypothetical protein IO90_03030 [Chryseobacterium sp. FH1]
MKRINLFFLIVLFVPSLIFCQDDLKYSNVKTNTDEVKIPGDWKQLNTVKDSGQTYLQNSDGVIIAIAQNPQRAYPFFKDENTSYENVKEFYKWDSDYRKETKAKTKKLKEDSKLEYIIWKYNDGKLDNVFLFGTSKNNFLNLLVYSKLWSEEDKIKFLENLYQLNKQ